MNHSCGGPKCTFPHQNENKRKNCVFKDAQYVESHSSKGFITVGGMLRNLALSNRFVDCDLYFMPKPPLDPCDGNVKAHGEYWGHLYK